VHPVGDLVESLGEIPDWEGLTETLASFASLRVAFTLGALVVIGFINRCIDRQLVI
jgi:hypothetical protein